MSRKAETESGTEDLLEARRLEAENAAGKMPEDDSQYDGKPKEITSSVNKELNPEELHALGESSLERFLQFGGLNDIHEAIEYGTQALNSTPEDHPDLPNRLESLGEAYFHRFWCLKELGDIKQAIEYKTRALALTPGDHPNFPDLAASLAGSYHVRFQRLGEMRDLEQALELETRALDSTPGDHPDFPNRVANQGMSYHVRFRLLGEMGDLERAIKLHARALDLMPSNQPRLPHLLENLGISYYQRFQRLGEMGDLEHAIKYKSRALDLTTSDYPDLPHRHASLGAIYQDRFKRLGMMNDLEQAIKHKTCALDSTPSGHPHLAQRLASLGVSYLERFQRLGDRSDIEQAIKLETHAADLTPSDQPHLPDRLASLSEWYHQRFHRLDEMGDLEQAIKLDTRALELTPSDHPDLPDRLASLGCLYHDRTQRLGKTDDIEKAIEYKTRALDLTPIDHSDLSHRLASLGVSYDERFKHLGEMDDVEKSNKLHTRALELTPSDDPDFPRRLADLGGSHYGRFRRLGEINDLEQAIKLFTRALDLTPSDHSGLPRRLDSLGVSYHERFQRLGEIRDLEQAIKHKTHALDTTPTDDPDLPHQLVNLGASYYARFQCLGEMSDLEQAIKHQTRALELTPADHSGFPSRLADLAASYHERFKRLGGISDLEQANKSLTHACNLIHNDHPTIPFHYNNLAQLQFHRFLHTGDQSILQQSLLSFRLASHSSTGPPRSKFEAALTWATLTAQHTLPNPLEAYRTAIDILPQFIWLGATTTQRYQDLLIAEGLAVKAASAAILSSDYSLALTWLEHARCVVWNQSLMLRSPVDQLQVSHPDLAARLQTVAKQLHNAGSEFTGPQTFSAGLLAITPEQYSQHRRRLAKEYSDLLSQAQALSGFENLLRPVHANDLIRAARHGPIVVLNCHQDHCAALIVVPGRETIDHLPLPDCSEKKMKEARSALVTSLRSKGIRERGFKHLQHPGQKDKVQSVLLTVWTTIVKPVLDFLGYTSGAPTTSLPHITWCPTGPLSFLPLHAAGNYDQPQSRVFDYAISSYTPTLTTLLSCNPSTLSRTSRVLAIGQARTPGRSPLPGTTTELECVRAHTYNKVEHSQLIDDQATTATVLHAMEHHDWVHLACHAHQNVQDPTKSGFFLHDGTLDLDTINRRSFKAKGLAFLSACQTATGDEKLPDEAIHLASGMLMAGYTSVIGTMWSVGDSDAPFVADQVYAELMKDGKVGNGEAGRALHYAVEALREKVGEKEFGRWVPYIHIGS